MIQLQTERLILRPFRESDLEDYYEYVSMGRVGPQAGWQPYTSIERARERLLVEMSKPNQFAIELKGEQKVIGSIEVMNVKREKYKGIDIEENSKELGSVISEKYWGRGFAPETVVEILRYCFLELNVDAVYACYLERNQQSKRVMEKMGFSIIGRVPNHRKWIDGQVADLIAVRITKDEYERRSAC